MKKLLLSLWMLSMLLSQIQANNTFGKALFAKAKKEHKIIVLDIEAVWCHWCHVMDKKTYANKEVKALLDKHFLFVKVDHDARPDLAQKYRDYGWPATIFLDGDGKELVKRAGYIAPDNMVSLLKAILKDPSAEKTKTTKTKSYTASILTKELGKKLEQAHHDTYDTELGGLKISQKFLDADSVLYAMFQASQGNTLEEARAKQTLDAGMKLIDPVWGGAYQYSTHGDWNHAHYEKIMRIQSRYIKIYALASKQFESKAYLDASKRVASYVLRFLKDKNGAFYVSQDSDISQGEKAHKYFEYDNKKRLSLGIPKIDKHLYASSQGLMIEALAYLYEASSDKKYLEYAKESANWTLKNRFVNGGGFSHDKEYELLYLNDNLFMGKGLLALYRITGEVRWLRQASKLGYFLARHFKAPKAGIFTATDNGTPIKPIQQIDENINTARFMNLLAHYTGKSKHKAFAQHIMRYLANRSVALSRITEAGILLSDYEFSHKPIHLTIDGDTKDKRTKILFDVALKNAGEYARVELLNLKKAKAYNDDVKYPKSKQPSAYICTDNRCSFAIHTSKEFQEVIDKFK
jgi:uncharacterized protein YyaL (SSP411 family)